MSDNSWYTVPAQNSRRDGGSPGTREGRGGTGGQRPRGRGGRSRRSGNGRNLGNLETSSILGVINNLNLSSLDRIQQLLDLRRSALGIQGPPQETTGTPEQSTSTTEPAPQRVRVWDRPVMRRFPQITEWGRKSRTERAADTAITRLVSILTGVVARGTRQGLSESNIFDGTRDLVDGEDTDALKLLYRETAPPAGGDTSTQTSEQKTAPAGGETSTQTSEEKVDLTQSSGEVTTSSSDSKTPQESDVSSYAEVAKGAPSQNTEMVASDTGRRKKRLRSNSNDPHNKQPE